MLFSGGGSSLSNREREKIREEVDAEFEAGEMVLAKKRKGKKLLNKNQSEADDFGSLFGDRLSGKLPRFANKITLKVWGVEFNIACSLYFSSHPPIPSLLFLNSLFFCCFLRFCFAV